MGMNQPRYHQLENSYRVFLNGGSPGEMFLVGNSDSAQGTKAFDTIAKALNMCKANRNDVIFVMPGHAETIVSAAGALALNKAGANIIGIGNGATRPTITFGSAATAIVNVTGANTRLENFLLYSDFADIVTGINVNAKGFSLVDCEFREQTAKNFLVCIQTNASNASDDFTIENCEFNCPDALNTECIEIVGASARGLIRNCKFKGDWGVATISAITAASTNLRILDNQIQNDQTGNVFGCIDLVAATTGYIDGNDCFNGYTTAIQTIDSAACMVGQNYESEVIGERGKLFGTVSA